MYITMPIDVIYWTILEGYSRKNYIFYMHSKMFIKEFCQLLKEVIVYAMTWLKL